MSVFECPTYRHIFSDELSKLNPKSKQCIFLRFEKEMKGYKLWDPFARKVVISKDIIFDEKSMLESAQEEKK